MRFFSPLCILISRQWNAEIDFSIDNALQCDCSAMWLKEYLLINQPYYQSVLCGGPDDDDFRGSYLLTAPLEERNCCKLSFVTSLIVFHCQVNFFL